MKTRNILAALLLFSAGFTACVTSGETEGPDADQVLIVKLPENVVSTRAVQDPVPTQSSTVIKDATVFLLSGQSVEAVATFLQTDIDNKYKRIDNVKGSVDNVIVVANKQVDDDISTLKNADAIRNFAFTVASQHKSADDGVAGKTLIGEGSPVLSTDPVPNPDPAHKYKVASIKLDAITARIEVGAVKAGEGVESVELVAMFVNNYYQTWAKGTPMLHSDVDPVWVASPIASGQNQENPIPATTTPAYTHPDYKNTASADVKLEDNSKCYAFHVFHGNIPHVVMLVKGKYADKYYEDNKPYFLGYVTFTKFRKDTDSQLITSMEGNKIYKMGLGKTGIEIKAKDITDKPEKGEFDLRIDVSVEEWTEEVVTPEV